jgi:hypothetical protein
VKPSGISGKTKLMSLQETVRTRILETCTYRGINDFKEGPGKPGGTEIKWDTWQM